MKLEKRTFETISKEFPCFDFELEYVPRTKMCKARVKLNLFAEVDIERNIEQIIVAVDTIKMVLNKFLCELSIVVPILEKQPNISTKALMEKLEETLGIKK